MRNIAVTEYEMEKKPSMNLSVRNKPANCSKRFFLRAIAALTLVAVLFLAGCSNPGSGTETPNRRTVCAKWVITDPDARFVSIELTDDEVYIVVEREENSLSKGRANAVGEASLFGKAALLKAKAVSQTSETSRIYTGKYTISKDSKTVNLINFGTLQIDLSSDKKSAAFKLELAPNVPPFNGDASRIYELNVERAVEIASSENTNLLCHHWNYVRYLLNGELWEPWKDPDSWKSSGWRFPESEPQTTILFSKAGTCLQTTIVNGADTLTSLGRWKWVDGNENAIYYANGQTGDWQPEAVNITLTGITLATAELINSEYTLTTEYKR